MPTASPPHGWSGCLLLGIRPLQSLAVAASAVRVKDSKMHRTCIRWEASRTGIVQDDRERVFLSAQSPVLFRVSSQKVLETQWPCSCLVDE
jgi:hypothetical protein